MRLSLGVFASSLVLLAGCPSDDGGTNADTGGTGMTSNGMTSNGMTSNGMTSNSTTNGTTNGMTTMPPDTDTDDPMTTTIGGSSSSSSGSGSTTAASGCAGFCADYFVTCGANGGNDYGTEAGCSTVCENDEALFFMDGCRVMHLGLAAGDADTHCPHANSTGSGVCPDAS